MNVSAARDLETGAAILVALGALTENERFVFVCHEWHDMTFANISGRLEVSTSRVNQLHKRAVAKLRRALAPLQHRLAA